MYDIRSFGILDRVMVCLLACLGKEVCTALFRSRGKGEGEMQWSLT